VVQPVPAAILYTSAARTHHGLKSEYFDNTELKGEPVLRRTDASVNFSWGFNSVTPALTKNYSVRWTGELCPDASADYILGFTGQDGYRVWIDGNLQAEDWTPHRPSTTQTNPIHLERGHAYQLKIEHFQTVRSAEARLVWGVPGKEEREAVQAAKAADIVVAVLGLSARVEGEEMKVKADGFSGGDRTRLDLPAPQQQLLESLVATRKPVILVLTSGSALAIPWADIHVPAILEAWYPGESGGQAVAEALAGDINPSGRLPITFYQSVDQLPPFEDYSMAHRTYRYFEGVPLYPFGYGLGYTTFHYENATVAPADSNAPEESHLASVDVTNTGSMAGDEVVQLYLSHPGIPGAPLRALEGFQRVHLKSGEKRRVSFALRASELSVVDGDGRRKVIPGEVDVWIGGGQPFQRPGLTAAPGIATSFNITTAATLPD